MSHTANTKLVILGGGASGLLIAMKLANTKYLDITLIDSKVRKYIYETTKYQRLKMIYSLFMSIHRRFVQFYMNQPSKNLKNTLKALPLTMHPSWQN
jgi:NADH dehydrogenase FAD-containing subunit